MGIPSPESPEISGDNRLETPHQHQERMQVRNRNHVDHSGEEVDAHEQRIDQQQGSTSEKRHTFVTLRRRGVLRALGVAATSLAALGVVSEPTVGTNGGSPDKEVRRSRQRSAAKRRIDAAIKNTITREYIAHPINGDELWHDTKFASYSKGLPHDALGEVNRASYQTLTDAVEGKGEFSAISLSGTRLLENPEAAYSFNMSGYDPNDVFIEPPPAFASAETAAEMIELYWQALLRDIPFTEYDTHPLAKAAMEELSTLEDFLAPTANGIVTAGTLFRGNHEETLTDPPISQFFYKAVQRGPLRQHQKIPVAKPGLDYMTEYQTWLDIQNGTPPTESEEYVEERYLIIGRDPATWVHRDTPHQPSSTQHSSSWIWKFRSTTETHIWTPAFKVHSLTTGFKISLGL